MTRSPPTPYMVAVHQEQRKVVENDHFSRPVVCPAVFRRVLSCCRTHCSIKLLNGLLVGTLRNLLLQLR